MYYLFDGPKPNKSQKVINQDQEAGVISIVVS